MMNRRSLILVGLALVAPSGSVAALPDAPPEQVGLDPARLARIDEAVAGSIAHREVPGAVVLVGRRGKVVFARAYGLRRIGPAAEPMTRDSIFDLASLTKPIATATSILILVERGRLRLDDRLGDLLPEFDNHGKGEITVEHLLRHRAGLIADDPLADFADGPERAWERIARLELLGRPGERFRYSDVGFLILGRLVERRSGRPLDRFAHENIFDPLGMADTGFRPEGRPGPIGRIAPTEDRGETPFLGIVHDPRARALGGVAGHAGLFGTADDLAVFAQMLLDDGAGHAGGRILKPETVRAMIDPADTPAGQKRGLGWDVATGYSSPRGAWFGPSSFGHTGFTGTSLWIDPRTQTSVILLTSRLYLDGRAPTAQALRAEVATLVAEALVDAPWKTRPVP